MTMACAEYHMRKWQIKNLTQPVTFIALRALQETNYSAPHTMRTMEGGGKNINVAKQNNMAG